MGWCVDTIFEGREDIHNHFYNFLPQKRDFEELFHPGTVPKTKGFTLSFAEALQSVRGAP